MKKLMGTTLAVGFLSSAVCACDLALVLAVDISGSVDGHEFQTQMDGLALGLRDGIVAESLVRGKAAISLVQWTGESRQHLSIPFRQIQSWSDLETLAVEIENTPRKWLSFSTAIGEAMAFSADLFSTAPTCTRRVIDVSGDGVSNEGRPPRSVQAEMKAQGITVNALVIEGEDDELTAYFWENVITGEGAFVVTANGYGEYPEKMRKKLLREVSTVVSGIDVVPDLIPAAQR